MIVTRFAMIEPADWGCVSTFFGGGTVPAQHHPDDPDYRLIAKRCGYGDDTLAYCIEHEVAHHVLEETLHDRPSRVLYGLARGRPVPHHEAAYEEAMTQMLQRFVRGGERPIIGGIPWQRLADTLREAMA